MTRIALFYTKKGVLLNTLSPLSKRPQMQPVTHQLSPPLYATNSKGIYCFRENLTQSYYSQIVLCNDVY